ncbi:hypothetical protein GGU10DRAFT_275948 [Lentinula aff. detonsa]|uniref:LCCL domain-containing protein n=1 Tax=Lentinula aff. detonsa TaxID=2804958 RepID=A0AA38KCP4_9AGAR|nr:hypothetical protein GGU10DRAFT_275948 [Lentinula aff. detonsa]
MAVPASMTTLNLSGKFSINKTLSHPPEEILELQGVALLKRKAMGAATLTVTVKHNKNDSGEECLSLEQTIAGLDLGEPEVKVLNWVEQTRDTKLIGTVVTKAKRVKVDEVENAYLKEEWSADTLENGCILVHVAPAGTESWSAEQTWGIGEVNGERRHVRRIAFAGPNKKLEHRFVYDYREWLAS